MALELTVKKQLAGFPLDLSLTSDSRRIGILGPSGCGKSMTLKMLAGVVAPDGGRIQVDGWLLYDSEKRISLPPRARKVGYLFQNYALFPAMTVAQNIAAGLRCPKRERQARVDGLIRRFRLEGLENRRPGQISGGQQQRTALARMMAAEPETILLDEPFSALDLALRETVQAELLEFLSDYPGQVIMVSHSLEELYRFCDFLAVMERGRLLTAGDRDRVFQSPGSVPVARLVGCENILPAKRVDEHHLLLTDWGVTLTTAWQVPENATALGVRAQAPGPASEPGENRIPVLLRSRTETPFRCRLQVIPPRNPEAVPLWWEQGKGSADCPGWLWVPPEEVLPLTP
ncbi:MAG: sulfate/molybdate ABC transporter ATP-binding protein [Candidatus Onthomonas sp.]